MSDTLLLQSRLDLPAAAPLAQELRKRLGSDVTVDAGAVTHMGALCLQVMVSAAKTLTRAGHRFRMINASDRVLEQLVSMGFTPETLSEVAK
ncbi:MAG: STAS domain-containing protein [Pseudooceanicola sp.]